MTTVAAQVPIIRRLLNDNPIEAHLNGAIADTTTETFVVDSIDTSKFKVGQVWEHETGGELRRVYSVDVDTNTPSAYRGYKGSTAATQADNSFLYLEPRFEYTTIDQAINHVLDYDLFPKIYEIQEHEYTTSATSRAYNANSTGCEKILDVYQRTVSTNPPQRGGITYTVYPQNVDTDLWSNGKMFEFIGGTQNGTDKFYVNCAHRVTIGTLLSRQERLVQVGAAKYLLEWSTIRRLAGPTNQGDRSVRPADPLVTARYYSDLFEKMKREESEYLRKQVPRRKVWVSGTVTYASAG